MTHARLLWCATLTLAIALSTWAYGWAAVAVLPAAWAWIRRDDAAMPLLAGLAGALAWGGLLAVQAAAGPVGRVAEVTGAAMQVGGPALYALTLAFPALLATASAGLVRGLTRR